MPGMQISPPPGPPKEICKIESFPSDSKIWNQKWNYKNWQYTAQAPAVETETRANWIVSPSEKITQPFALGPLWASSVSEFLRWKCNYLLAEKSKSKPRTLQDRSKQSLMKNTL